MRILQIHAPYRRPGGEDRVVELERALLRDAGHDVHQHIAPNPTGALATASALARSSWNAKAARAVRDAVRTTRPDIVHVHNTWFGLSWSVIEAAAGEGVPVVLTLHNHRLVCAAGTLFRDGAPCDLCVGRAPLPGIRHRCYRDSAIASTAAAAAIARPRGTDALRGVRACIAPTTAIRDTAIAAGIPAERVHVHWHCTTDGPPRTQAPSASRRVVAAGRLVPEKGFDVLLQAWRGAGLGAQGWTLDVFGEGPHRSALEALASDGVSLPGWVESRSLADALRHARLAVVPSRWSEPFGLVAIEALAVGTGVVASDSGDLAAIVADAGAVVPPGDGSALGQALLLASDDDRVDRWGAAARNQYVRYFTPAAGLERLLGVYTSVLAPTPAV